MEVLRGVRASCRQEEREVHGETKAASSGLFPDREVIRGHTMKYVRDDKALRSIGGYGLLTVRGGYLFFVLFSKKNRAVLFFPFSFDGYLRLRIVYTTKQFCFLNSFIVSFSYRIRYLVFFPRIIFARNISSSQDAYYTNVAIFSQIIYIILPALRHLTPSAYADVHGGRHY